MLGDFAEELRIEWALETELPLLSRYGSLRSQLKHTGGQCRRGLLFLYLCFTFPVARILQCSGILIYHFLLALYFNYVVFLFFFLLPPDVQDFRLCSSRMYFQNIGIDHTRLWTSTCRMCIVIKNEGNLQKCKDSCSL